MARKAAAALAAGCTCAIKTAGETPFAANALALLAERAGVSKGVINIVTALHNTPEIGQALCESTVVKKISFTGSTRVGKLLMQQCSAFLFHTTYLLRTTLDTEMAESPRSAVTFDCTCH